MKDLILWLLAATAVYFFGIAQLESVRHAPVENECTAGAWCKDPAM